MKLYLFFGKYSKSVTFSVYFSSNFPFTVSELIGTKSIYAVWRLVTSTELDEAEEEAALRKDKLRGISVEAALNNRFL